MIALSLRFPHHGCHSAYHHLCDYLPTQDRVVDASIPRYLYLRPRRFVGILHRCWRQLHETRAWKLAHRHGHDWVHYLYPEHGYFFGHRLRETGEHIALSCHLPESLLRENRDRMPFLMSGLAAADALIVMSPDQIKFYQTLAPQARIAFIPHGVDVEFFCPGAGSGTSTAADSLRILTVGNMLRDFPTLAGTIELAAGADLRWRFVVIALRSHLDALEQLLSARARALLDPCCGVSDFQLLEFYRQCDVLFLPLLSATANNALIEAMACGLPILVTDFEATRAYALDCAEYVEPRNPQAAFVTIQQLARDPGRLAKMSEKSRRLAEENLAWGVICKAQRQFLGRDA